MSIFKEISTISCLSKAISGRITGSSQTALVTPKDCNVWEATWPMLSPVINARQSDSFAMASAIRII